ncbi:hypothetical protein GYMLUDRAFT_76833 [Collybiopsis luxurians FD-317 M1]|uniref:RTA1-domain-containing protein n=1 Tax=Collybiopsis luxurians FD-317 M1 TaxID=944289 RepID=A0A0D0BJP1_9AGAR|nr:hypothetical protein GYMLUDRAFT_76833 [Collybiopsis luxurians FD-317 M1]
MFETYSTSLNSLVSRANSTQTDAQEVNPDPYGYKPTFAVCILFLSLFGVSTFIHFCQAIAYRKWFFLYTAVFAGLIELAGWSGRLWSNQNLSNNNAFLIQIVCTIIAPTPLLAANFVILARIIKKLDDCYSRLGPRLYSRIFLSCDIIALVVQGAGGGIASGTVNQDVVNLGSHVMLAGIVFQLVVMICFMMLAMEFFYRYSSDLPIRKARIVKPVIISNRMEVLVYAGMFNTICLFIRAIYRTVELADGFDGEVIRTQWLFNFFDATMVVLAMFTYNFAHPGRLLEEDNDENDSESLRRLPMDDVALKA